MLEIVGLGIVYIEDGWIIQKHTIRGKGGTIAGVRYIGRNTGYYAIFIGREVKHQRPTIVCVGSQLKINL